MIASIVSIIIFAVTLYLIFSERLNRTIASIGGAVLMVVLGQLENPSNGQPLRPCVKNSLFEQEIAEGCGREVLARWPSATEFTRLKLMEFNGGSMVSLEIPPMVNLCGLL